MADQSLEQPTRTQSPTGALRTLKILLIGGVALAALVFAARLLVPGLFADNSTSVEYITEAGKGTAEGTVNSQLIVTVHVPWSGGSGQTTVSAMSLTLLDESDNPAIYGDKPAPSLPMRPTVDIQTWEYAGSLPSKPGTYHPRLQWRSLSGDRSIQTLDVPGPILIAKADTSPPIKSGFVFNAEGDLWMLSTDGSKQRRFTFLSTLADRVEYPSWSPDGKSIAFAYLTGIASNELPKTSIWAIDADGTGARLLVEHGPDESLSYPQWSPDGSYLYFTVENLLRDINGAGLPRRIDRVDLATGIRTPWIASAAQPDPTGAGSELLFLEEVNDTQGQFLQLQISKAESGNTPPTVVVPATSFFDLYAPRMSPDRKKVVFAAAQLTNRADNRATDFNLLSWLTFEPRVASAHNFPWELFLVPASGGDAQRLTQLNDDQPFSIWLDDNTIAFIGIKGLYKLAIDQSGNPVSDPIRLTDGVQHAALTWHAP